MMMMMMMMKYIEMHGQQNFKTSVPKFDK